MVNHSQTTVAIVDYGLGNLFSVKHACERVGLRAVVTSNSDAILAGDGILLPGVGAFGDAMQCLERLNLTSTLRAAACAGKPLVGICLGMQLLMTVGNEFGRHRGLGILPGEVIRFNEPQGPRGTLKVPQVGWNTIHKATVASSDIDSWRDTPLSGLPDGTAMYFVHSYHVVAEDREMILSTTRYGDSEFCSSIRHRNVVGMQFHPERSGLAGLKIYHMTAEFIRKNQIAKERRYAA